MNTAHDAQQPGRNAQAHDADAGLGLRTFRTYSTCRRPDDEACLAPTRAMTLALRRPCAQARP
ncbi:hypothetical protein [Paraburkholderia sp. J94]|uniref:hypothetical protein n=1 Tax=Paraburkholderia sp. J94 TaxID=2805441 RepID=UPI002AAF1A9D|nr:hypothetical protein [Paraburkholderia sp. J94]